MDASPIHILNELPQIVIVGTGLLGGSIGLGLKKAGYKGRILGVGRRESSLQAAIDKGCIDHSQVIGPDIWRFDRPTLVVLATPISQFEDHFRQIAQAQQEHQAPLFITDVGSTKAQVCHWARKHLPQPGCFLGAHPMAGSEKQGATYADADLFQGRPCILTQASNTSSDCTKYVEALWLALGMRLLHMRDTEHDQAVAAISHLPHAMAMLLVLNAARHEHALEIAAGGFRDTTRVASGDVSVWTDIFMTNRQAMIDMIDQITTDLAALREQLAQGDQPGIAAQLAQAKALRDQWASHPQQGASLPGRSEP